MVHIIVDCFIDILEFIKDELLVYLFLIHL